MPPKKDHPLKNKEKEAEKEIKALLKRLKLDKDFVAELALKPKALLACAPPCHWKHVLKKVNGVWKVVPVCDCH